MVPRPCARSSPARDNQMMAGEPAGDMTSHPVEERTAVAPGTAVIVGVGPGLGVALARAFADAGHPVAMLDRDKARLDTDAAELASTGQDVRGYVADAADPGNLRAALRFAITELGAPDVLVYHVAAVRKDSAISGDDQDWANGTAIGVLGARVAANTLLPELRDGRESLLFTGGGFALHPREEYASLSVGKAALRPARGRPKAAWRPGSRRA